MALQKNLSTIYGIDLNNAYCRVDNIVINAKTNMSFLLKVYADKTAKEIQSDVFRCAYEIDGANPLAQAYNHLKTLPEFAGAFDC
jgi:hypothetical protein